MKLSKETALYEKDAIKNGLMAAGGTATKYVSTIDQNGIFVAPEGEHPSDTITPTGWKISDAIELFKNGVSYIRAWLDNTVPKVRIGPTSSSNIVIDNDGFEFNQNGSRIASIGAITNPDGVQFGGGSSNLRLSTDGWYVGKAYVAEIRGENDVGVSIMSSEPVTIYDSLANNLSDTQSARNTVAGVTDFADGGYLDLEPARYLLIGTWTFSRQTGSETQERHVSVRLYDDTNNVAINTVTHNCSKSYIERVQVVGLFDCSGSNGTTRVYVQGASSTVSVSASSQKIEAHRLL